MRKVMAESDMGGGIVNACLHSSGPPFPFSTSLSVIGEVAG